MCEIKPTENALSEIPKLNSGHVSRESMCIVQLKWNVCQKCHTKLLS